MTTEEKAKITELRRSGMGYLKISQTLGINHNTVKTFCRRNNLTGSPVDEQEQDYGVYQKPCQCCGVPVTQYPGRKEKKFCSDACRNKWWNTHLKDVRRRSMYEYTCPHCGQRFSAYGNRNRKYCSHECYIAERFGGGSCV